MCLYPAGAPDTHTARSGHAESAPQNGSRGGQSGCDAPATRWAYSPPPDVRPDTEFRAFRSFAPQLVWTGLQDVLQEGDKHLHLARHQPTPRQYQIGDHRFWRPLRQDFHQTALTHILMAEMAWNPGDPRAGERQFTDKTHA